MPRYFGTDGIRGQVGQDPMSPSFLERLGVAVALFLESSSDHEAPYSIVVGRDTRASGIELEAAFLRGFKSVLRSARITRLGIVPTPVVADATVQLAADMGVVLTASHNPACDNGIKFFNHLGLKLTPGQEEAIEGKLPRAVSRDCEELSLPEEFHQPVQAYLERIHKAFGHLQLRGQRIVLDTANGAACATTPSVLKSLGAELIELGNRPDGQNINAGCGSEHPEKLCAAVKEHGALLGIAHDGDGDRLVVCDAKGQLLDGDKMLGILALYLNQSNRLPGHSMVATIQSNLGLDQSLEEHGIRTRRVDIGDRHVAYKLRNYDLNFGGESSGHIIIRDILPTGDGLIALLTLLSAIQAWRKPLHELAEKIRLYPQLTDALRIREKKPFESLRNLNRAMDHISEKLGESGRLLVRYSGTENKLRLLVEAPMLDLATTCMQTLKNAASSDLQVLP